MTVLLWILGILLTLTVLLCLTRIGATVHFDERITVDLKFGPLRLHIDPLAPKESVKAGTAKKPAKQKKEITAADLKGKFPKVTFADVREMYHTLWPVAKKALSRTRRGIRLKPFRLAVFLGGGDPADLAEWYGWLNTAVWTIMPQLERMLVIPAPSIHIELDFEAERTSVRGEVGLDVRIGTLLHVGLEAGVPSLKWFLRFMKTHKRSVSVKRTEPVKTPDTNTAA